MELLLLPLILLFIYFCSSVRFLGEYERLVVFRFGAMNRLCGPGFAFVWSFIEVANRLDVSENTEYINEIRLPNNEPLLEQARFKFRITDPVRAMSHAADNGEATSAAVRQAILDVLPKCTVLEALKDIARLEQKVAAHASKRTAQWGTEVTGVTLRDIPIPCELLQMMANVAHNLSAGIALTCTAQRPKLVEVAGGASRGAAGGASDGAADGVGDGVADRGAGDSVADGEAAESAGETEGDVLSTIGQLDYKFGL